MGQSLHCITVYPKHYLTAISTCSFVPDLSGSGKRATTTHASFVATSLNYVKFKEQHSLCTKFELVASLFQVVHMTFQFTAMVN